MDNTWLTCSSQASVSNVTLSKLASLFFQPYNVIMLSIEFGPFLWVFGMATNINPLYPFMQHVNLDSRVRALVDLAIVA